MAYTTTPYATAEQVYNALGLNPDSQAADAAWIANDLLPQAQNAIDEFVGFPFQTDGSINTPATRVYSGNENPVLLTEPISTLTQVLEISQGEYLNYGSTGNIQLILQTLDITQDCVLGPDNLTPGFTLRRISQLPFYTGSQNYTVKGVFGYTAVPAQITRALIRLVIHYYKMRDFNYAGSTGNQQYGGQKFDMCDIPEDVDRILRRYRLPVFFTW